MQGDRIINAHCFECENIQGTELESLVGFYDGQDPYGMDIILLKLKGVELWQRFFLDAGIGFWENYDQVSAFEDYEDLIPINIADKYSLKGLCLQHISCIGNNKELSIISFKVGKSNFILMHKDTKNIESETIFKKL
jgi:hypothetical protein